MCPSGGGLFVSELKKGFLLLDEVRFIGNRAYSGGGLAAVQCNISMDTCTFVGNRAASRGGGMR